MSAESRAMEESDERWFRGVDEDDERAAPAVSGETSERDELAKWVELAEGKIAELQESVRRLTDENETLRARLRELESTVSEFVCPECNTIINIVPREDYPDA